MFKYILHVSAVIAADLNLHVVCLVSALGLLVSAAVLPHSRDQLATRPLLYAHSRIAN